MDLSTALTVWSHYEHTWHSGDPLLESNPHHFTNALADMGIVNVGPWPAEVGRTVVFAPGHVSKDTREGTIVTVLDAETKRVRVRVARRAEPVTMDASTPGFGVCESRAEGDERRRLTYATLDAAVDFLLLAAPEHMPASLFEWLRFGSPAANKREDKRAERYAALADTFAADTAPAAPILTAVPDAPQAPARRVAVIGCSKDKLGHAAPAGELYLGNFHARGRTAADALLARGEVDAVLILSARHGLLDLDQPTAPYDTTWRDAEAIPVARLARQLRERGVTQVVALTSKDYTARLTEAAADVAAEVVAPLAGSPGILNMNARLARIRRGQSATEAATPARCNDWRALAAREHPALIPDPLARTVQPALFAV